ncbi:MAG: tetratricopeptide repeat protein [Phototrophicaceae bacterium]|jgi:tetratricopeptide (TPR) repeat protein
MGFGGHVRGAPNRRRGCLPLIGWLGVLINLAIIAFTLRDRMFPTLSAWWQPAEDPTIAALTAFERGDYTRAIQESSVALSQDPTNGSATMTHTRALIYRSYVDFRYSADLTDALAFAAQQAERAPQSADALAAYAFALQANGDGATAATVANRALMLVPTHVLARTALALGYARVGSFEIALRESQAALEADPQAPEAFDARRAVAISTADLGRYSDAGDQLQTLIARYEGSLPLYFERALYARQVGDAEAAENAYFAVLTRDPDNIKARLRLCELANALGQPANALGYCGEVTTLAATLPEGWYQLGRAHYLLGDFTTAQQTLNRCSSLQVLQDVPPEQRIFECWYLQGQAAEIRGDCNALIATYNQFQQMASNSSVRETWVYPPEGPPMCAP